MTPDLIQQARAEWERIPHAPNCAAITPHRRKGMTYYETDSADEMNAPWYFETGPCNCFRSTSVIPKALDALEADSKRLDWLDSQPERLGDIEPGSAFPDRRVTIWEDGTDRHLGRGKTFREAIDAAMKGQDDE